MEGGDREPRVLERGCRWPELVEGVDDRVQHAAAGIPPARGVQRDRELAVALPVQTRERLDEPEEVGALLQPRREKVTHGGPKLASAVPKEIAQQVVAALEVVHHTGIGHADPGGDGADLDCCDASFGEER